MIKKVQFLILLTIVGVFFFGAAGAQAAEMGEQINFFVDASYDSKNRAEITATMQVKSQRAYFYVDDDYWGELASSDRDNFRNSLKVLGEEFDLVIYPKERAVFGSEWSPGIDGDERITILVSALINEAGGYFNTNDEYPQSLFPVSNQREMIYLNSSYIKGTRAKSFLAHEFQHLITFYQKNILYNLEEDIWLNEARSEYAPTLLGYDDIYSNSNLEKRAEVFLDNPLDSLTEWKNKITDYGVVALFIQYLVDHYGEEILTRMVLNDRAGIDSIDHALIDLGRQERFSDIFTNWAIANYLNNCQVGLNKDYCYLNEHLTYERLHLEPTAGYSGFPNLIVSRSSAVKDWAPVWYRFRPLLTNKTEKDMLKIEFIGSSKRADFQASYVVIDKDNQVDVNFISLSEQKGVAYIPNFISLIKSVILIPFNKNKKSGFTDNELSTPFSFTASSVASEGLIINSVSPFTGPAEGGTRVTVKGINFEPKIQVVWGGVIIANMEVIDRQTIIFNSPSHSAGVVDLTVINPDKEKAELLQAFTYLGGFVPSYPDGSLIRAKGDHRVYIVKGKYKRWIQSAKIFDFYGHLNWEAVIEVSPEERDAYQDAWLIREANDRRVYEINSDLTKHWLNMTAEEFGLSGRRWDMVYVINESERDLYKMGRDVMFN